MGHRKLAPSPSVTPPSGEADETACSLTQPAATNLVGAESVGDLAQREGYTPELYTVALSEAIRSSAVPLDMQRERLAQLASVGAVADKASADELARHFTLLEALFHRFSHAAVEAMRTGGTRGGEVSERYLSGALKAQRTAVACLSALKVLRSGQAPAPTAAPAPAPTTPAIRPESGV